MDVSLHAYSERSCLGKAVVGQITFVQGGSYLHTAHYCVQSPPGLGYSEGGSKASEYQGDEKEITLECASHSNIIISHEINSHAKYIVAFDQ